MSLEPFPHDTLYAALSEFRRRGVGLNQITEFYHQVDHLDQPQTERWCICDLDGTLADSRHRDHLALNRQWDEFNSQCVNDPPHPDVQATLKGLLLQGWHIAVVTGREASYLRRTQQWLHGVAGVWDPDRVHIYMRPEQDYRSDVVVKREIYEKHLRDKNVMFVLEDRDRVVEMWRDLGLRCHQVQKGTY